MNKFLMTVAAFGVMVAPAFAATSDKTAEFIKMGAVSNMFEIETSKLALQKSSDAEVKKFAQQMIDDHTKAGKEMKAALTKEQATLVPAALDEKHQEKLDDLKDEDSADFDEDYLEVQVDAHKEAVSLFEDYSKDGDDVKLKNFATKTLPTLKAHHEHVKTLEDKK